MANWYVSSVAYSAVQTWATIGASQAVSLGTICRQTSPALNAERCFRCTTAGNTGTAEPTWNLTNNSTTSEAGHGGTAVWTECTGQEAHQQDNGTTTTWACPAARANNLTSTGKNVLAFGDKVFLSSDHAESQSAANSITFTGAAWISVSRTSGNVPPLPADISSGASIATTLGSGFGLTLNLSQGIIQGVSFTCGGTSFAFSGFQMLFKDCSMTLLYPTGRLGFNQKAIVFDNTPISFPGTGAALQTSSAAQFEWRNTPNAIQGTVPTALFPASAIAQGSEIKFRGVDLSAAASGKTIAYVNGDAAFFRAANCNLGVGVTLIGGTVGNGSYAEFLNCDSGNTNYNSTWGTIGGTTVTDTSTTRVSGASDGTTAYSRKMASYSFDGLPLYNTSIGPLTHDHHIWQWNDLVGSSKTATVEIISSGTLTNTDIVGELEYLADTGDCLSGFVNNGAATLLTAGAALPSSSASWNNPPATPVAQKLQVTFTPQKKGLLHFVVRLLKPSATVWVDPLITVG